MANAHDQLILALHIGYKLPRRKATIVGYDNGIYVFESEKKENMKRAGTE